MRRILTLFSLIFCLAAWCLPAHAQAPTITSFSPTSGPVGTTVVLTGTNFTGTTVVGFQNKHATSFTVNSPTQITTSVPNGAATGPVAVATPAGTAHSSTNFTVTIAAPTITSFTPTSGPVGTSVTITGTSFTGASAVTFNGTTATSYTVTSDTSITATVPTGATTGTLSVTTPGGTATSSTSFTVTVPAPTITSFTPTSGPVGTSVVITGTNFTGTTVVGFQNKHAVSFVVNSPTQITTSVPSGAATGPVAVATPGGTVHSSASFTVTTAAVLTSVAVNPTSVSGGSSSTGTVTLSSAAPAGGSVVTLSSNNTAAATVPATVTVAAGATTATFTVTTLTVATSASVTITASLNTASKTAALTVNASSSTPAPQNLVAISEYNSVALYWQIAYGTFYNVYRSSMSGGPYTPLTTSPVMAATYTDTSATNGNTYYYVVTAVVSGIESGYSNESNVVPGAISPPDVAAYTTGSGKISLYWSRVPNATGYNIYRGTTAGAENYAAPINGSSPVNTASYAGSGMDIYTDTGLTNGTDYFYTVKTVYSSGTSAPSTEDTDTPDASAVPWDSRNPSSVLAVFRSVFASDISNQGTGSYSLRVVGPDNSIYDASYSTVQPPDGTYSSGTYQFVQSDGVTTSLPDDLGQYDVPLSGMSPQLVGSILPASNGPYRRVRTADPGAYRGEAGIVDLPTPVLSDPRATPHGDTAMIFFGGSGNRLEVDAGLQYSTTYGAWEMFMNINHKYVGTKQNPAVPLFNHPHDFVNTPPGSGPTVAYWAWGTFPSTNRAKLSLLLVDDSIDGNDAGAIGGPSRYLGKTENIRAKRVHAIAQNAQGVLPTASVMDNAGWQQGYVALPDDAGSEVGWSTSDGVITSEDGSYDGGHSTVIANELSKYITEIGIDIIMDGS